MDTKTVFLPFALETLQIDVGQMGIATYPPGASYGPRTVREWEFIWLMEGDAVYTRGRVSVDAPQESMILCRPGEDDHFLWDPVRRTRHAYFRFHMLDPYSILPSIDDWPLVRQIWSGDDLMASLYRHILTWGNSDDRELLRMDVAHLLSVFFSGQSAVGSVRQKNASQAIEVACSYIYDRIDADPSAPIPLGELAEAAHVSPEHLCRLFKAALNQSPAKTVRLIRLERAATLLLRSNYSIGQIAEIFGFATPYHFSSSFKQEFGKSPLAMRQSATDYDTPPLPRLLSPVQAPF
ncbi:MAG: AraC family transcriptional regulator [Capsulimonadaceae bacterium]|nr:AraC family transcriptional regulator [Capsulimonadaceae bacterium]